METDLKYILLAEDEPYDVEQTLAALEERHLAAAVAVARDGAEVLDYLYCRGKFKTRAVGNPVVVLLDNKMPKVTGLEVLKVMRSDEHLKLIPVVVLTSSRDWPDLVEFYKLGVNAYIAKPVECAEFMKAVNQLGVCWTGLAEPLPLGVPDAGRRP